MFSYVDLLIMIVLLMDFLRGSYLFQVICDIKFADRVRLWVN